MAIIPYVQNDFRKGRLGSGMRTRQDTKAYASSVRDARNMMVTADGRLLRRWGTIIRRPLLGTGGRLESWDFASGDTTQFLLLFRAGLLTIYDMTLTVRAEFAGMPWTDVATDFLVVAAQRTQVIITDNSFQTILLNYKPADGTFSWTYFDFAILPDDSRVQAPFWRFIGPRQRVFLTNYTSAGTGIGYGEIITNVLNYLPGTFDLTLATGLAHCTTDVFLPEHVGTRMRLAEGEFEITAVTGPRDAQVKIWRDVRKLLDLHPFLCRADSDLVQVSAPAHGMKVGNMVLFGNIIGDAAGKLLVHINHLPTAGGATVVPTAGAAAYRVMKIVDDNFFEIEATQAYVNTGTTLGTMNWVLTSTPGSGREAVSTTGLYGGFDVFMIKVDGIPGMTEPAFGKARGWPQCCCWHETRLWLGGSTGLPDAMFGSQFAAPTNFDTGTGEPTDAVQIFGIGQQARIRHLVSAFDLIVLTDTAEFYIPGSVDTPITQETVRGVETTRYGCSYTMPRRFDGGTVFVETSGLAIRDMSVKDRQSDYEAPPLSVAVPEWVGRPKDSAVYAGSYGQVTPYMIFTNSDDYSALVLHSSKNDDSFGFMRWVLDTGFFHSFAGVGSRLFAIAERDGDSFLVEFDTSVEKHVTSDFSEHFVYPSPVSAVVSEHHAGRTVQVYSPSRFYSDVAVAPDGTVILPEPMTDIIIGDRMSWFTAFHAPVTSYPGSPSVIGKTQRIVSAKIAWDDTQTGKVEGMAALPPQNDVLLGDVIPLNEWREYHVGILGREPFLTISGDRPGRVGLQGASFLCKF